MAKKTLRQLMTGRQGFNLFSQPKARKRAKNPLDKKCMTKTRWGERPIATKLYNKYGQAGGATFRYGGGKVKVRGCDTKARSYNVIALDNELKAKRGIAKGADFAMPKSRMHKLRFNAKGTLPKGVGHYALKPKKGGFGIFGVEGYSLKTKPGKAGHNWRAYLADKAVMKRSARVKAASRLTGGGHRGGSRKVPRTVAGKIALAKLTPGAVSSANRAGTKAHAAGMNKTQSKKVAKAVALVTAPAIAQGVPVAAAQQVVAKRVDQLINKIADAPPAVQAEALRDFGHKAKKDIAVIKAETPKPRLARGKEAAAEKVALVKAAANPGGFRFGREITKKSKKSKNPRNYF